MPDSTAAGNVAARGAVGYNRAAVSRSRRRVLWARVTASAVLLAGAAMLAAPCAAQEKDSGPAIEKTAPGGAAAGEYDPLFDDLDGEYADTPSGFPDPLESVNRKTLAFNGFIDRWILDPITEAYGWFMPTPLKASLRHFFTNVGSISVFANQVLQLELERAGITLSRLVVNTTVGFLGLLDPATVFGLQHYHADFGQTLAKAGFDSGPYLIVPVLGPTDLRDGFGDITDNLVHPMTYFFGLAPAQRLTYGSGVGLSTREANYEALKALSESSLDYYAALRNAYYQARMAEIWEGRPPPPQRRRICDSMQARLYRQPWRIPVACRGEG